MISLCTYFTPKGYISMTEANVKKVKTEKKNPIPGSSIAVNIIQEDEFRQFDRPAVNARASFASITSTKSLVDNFVKRRMSIIVPVDIQSKMTHMKRLLSRRLSLDILKQKVKKRLVGDKSKRLIRAGKCIYLDCLNCLPWSFLRWPKKIPRSIIYHDFVFYGFVYALFASDGYLLSCLMQGFGYEYNLFTAGVITTPDIPKPHAFIPDMSLYSYAGSLIVLILASVISVIIGTVAFYSANRQYHYWYVSFISGILLWKFCLGLSVLPKEPFCNQVKPFMDEKLKFLVRNYYASSNVTTIPKSFGNGSSEPPKIIYKNGTVPWRVRNYVHSSFMDVLQNHYFCCGYKDFKDYLDGSLRYPENDTRHFDWQPVVPRSCCTPTWSRNMVCGGLRTVELGKTITELSAKLYKQGCSQKLHIVCDNVFFYLGRGMLIFCGWQSLLFIVILVCIAIQIRQIKRLERSSRFKVDPQILLREFGTNYDQTQYDITEIGQRKLQKSPHNVVLDKWYRDFLESYRSNRDRYNQNRMHAAQFGFEPHSSTSLAVNELSKVQIPLEKYPQGDIPIAVENIKPHFNEDFKKKYPHLRNRGVLSRYDTSMNPWVVKVAEERRHKYDRNELSIVQYNESDWEDSVKAKLLTESDTLNSYHLLGHNEKARQKHQKTHRVSIIPFQRKKENSIRPSYIKTNRLPPKTLIDNWRKNSADHDMLTEKKEEKLSELAKDPKSIFYKPVEEKGVKEIYIKWTPNDEQIWETEQQQRNPDSKRHHRKPSNKSSKHKEFLSRRSNTVNPMKKIYEPEIAPIRLNYLQYRPADFPGPRPTNLRSPTKVNKDAPDPENSEIPTKSYAKSSQAEKNEQGYYKYAGEDLYKGTNMKRKHISSIQSHRNEPKTSEVDDQLLSMKDSASELIINPRSKVPFDKTYYKEPSVETNELDNKGSAQTRFIGVPQTQEAPKPYVNLRQRRLEEKVSKFKWDEDDEDVEKQ